MRIAILSSGCLPVLDGVTISVDARVRRLAAGGHEVLLMAPRPADDLGPPDGLPDAVTFAGLPGAPFGAAAGDLNPLPAAGAVIDAALTAFRPDLIHVDEPERLAVGLRRLPAVAFARRHRIPVVAFFHTNFIDYWGQERPALLPWLQPFKAAGLRLVARLYNRFDATLVPSAETHRRLVRAGLGNGICGAFNGTDTARFSPALRSPGYWGRTWNLPTLDGQAVLLIAGRLTTDKGWADGMRVLSRLAARLAGRGGIVIAGDGALRPSIAALAQTLGPIHLIGAVPPPALGAVFANSDLFATFSRCENASLAVYEALASGLPVIAPRAGGIPGQVRDGETGLLVPPGDMDAMVGAVERLLGDPAFSARCARALAAERAVLDWDHAFAQWLEVISRLAAGRDRPLPR